MPWNEESVVFVRNI